MCMCMMHHSDHTAGHSQPAAGAVARTCTQCGYALQDDFVVCPNCGLSLRAACPGCQRAVNTAWRLCPYCGTELQGVSTPTLPVEHHH